MLRNFSKIWTKANNYCAEACAVQKRFAGHSKWQNIRHVKSAKDAQKSEMFTKLSRQIKLAVTEGGGQADPKLNVRLEQVLYQAKRMNMPAATIQNVLKSVQASKEKAQAHVIEIKGPGGCMILCETVTPNLHQLKQQISTQLRKHNCKYGDGGGKHLFEEKGIVLTEIPASNKAKPREEIIEGATEDAINCGAEDVVLHDDGVLEFSCAGSSLRNVRDGLEKLNYDILSASVEYIAHKPARINEDDLEMLNKLLGKLEEMSEVVRLSHNVD